MRWGTGAAAGWVALAALLPAPVRGQENAVRLPVSGTVWDSIAGAPLAGAVVEAEPAGVRTTTDEAGHFTLLLPPGTHELGFQHGQVAAWGALLHPATVTVERGPVVVSLATASVSTVLERTCGAGGSVVGGVVRDMLTRVPVARASVDVVGRLEGRREQLGRVSTELDGTFRLCVGGVPTGGVELQASIGGTRSRWVALDAGGGRVLATDLNVVVSQPARVSGRLMDGETGEAIADALVRVEGTRLGARSGAEGTFLLRGVPPGAVSLAVEHVRYGRRTTEVLAASGDSVHVEFELRSEAIPLEEMVVRVTRASTAERARMGTRYDGIDREDIERLLERSSSVVDMMRNANIPGLNLFYDGALLCVEVARRTGAFANQCQMADVYINDVRIHEAREFLTTLQPEAIDRVQVVSPLEAVGRFGGRAVRFGALLIYTIGN